ncbi:MAG: MFS transporter [Lachnospiraceae bacterium]|jgi:UMF1 family MFS transporter
MNSITENISGRTEGNGRLTRQEVSWVLYDVGNSAFTMMVSTIIPIYLDVLAEGTAADYLAIWSYAVSAATLISAVIGLIMGGLSDHRGLRKPIFAATVLIGALFCGFMGFAGSWQIYLIVFIIARILYSNSLVLYDSMLPDVTTPERMDRVSSGGYALGYIGSCIPFIAALILVLFYKQLGLTLTAAMAIAFCITAAWWALMSVPLLISYKQTHYAKEGGRPVAESFERLLSTFRKVRDQKHIFLFLLAFFFYIDGVYTIIDEASAYGTALGIDSSGLLIALLVTQFVACPCSILFGRLTDRVDVRKLIRICVIAYLGITIYAVFMQNLAQFFGLAIAVGVFQGGVQALSRSYYARLIPSAMSGEYFGLYDICGKGASFMGTTLVGLISKVTGSISLGVGAIAIIFIIGLLLFEYSGKFQRA